MGTRPESPEALAIRGLVIRKVWPPRQTDLTRRSALGGYPWLPIGGAWPRASAGDKRPLHHLLQIDLAELPEFPRRSLLPERGLLSFFYDINAQEPGGDPSEEPVENWRVVYSPDPSAAVPCTPPAGLGDFEFSLGIQGEITPASIEPAEQGWNRRLWLRWPIYFQPFESYVDPASGVPEVGYGQEVYQLWQSRAVTFDQDACLHDMEPQRAFPYTTLHARIFLHALAHKANEQTLSYTRTLDRDRDGTAPLAANMRQIYQAGLDRFSDWQQLTAELIPSLDAMRPQALLPAEIWTKVRKAFEDEGGSGFGQVYDLSLRASDAILLAFGSEAGLIPQPELERLGTFFGGSAHTLLAHPMEVQEASRLTAIDRAEGFGWARSDTRPEEWLLLLQLDSDIRLGQSFLFGDAGKIYFYIRESDLHARRFDRVSVTVDGH